MKLKELEEILLQHCYQMSILKRDANQKKKDSILDSLIASIYRSETSFEDVIKDVKNGEVIDINFFNKGGNIDNFIKPKWLKFAKALWRQRSVGLGTPNAASGEGELMFIFLSPDIKKPTRGDLLIKGESIELKGEGVRVNGKITGKTFRNLTIKLCNKYGLTPNKSNRTNLEAVEVEKVQHEDHWKSQISSLSEDMQKEFISEYLECIDSNKHDVSCLFENGSFNFQELRKKIVKILYSSMVKDRSFDKFILLGDGTDAKILTNDTNKFNENIDNGLITISSDYFRINQDTAIGWYIA